MEPRQELLRRIHKVRGKWNRFIWFRGLAWVLGVGVAALILAMTIAESGDISPWLVVLLRVGLFGALAGDCRYQACLTAPYQTGRSATRSICRRKASWSGGSSRQRSRIRAETALRARSVRDSVDTRCAEPDSPHPFRRRGQPPEVEHFRNAVGSLPGGFDCRPVLLDAVLPLRQRPPVCRGSWSLHPRRP